MRSIRLFVVGLILLSPVASRSITWHFDTAGDVEGWSTSPTVLSGGTGAQSPSRYGVRVEEGILKAKVFKGPDQRPSVSLRSPTIRADAALFNRLRFRMKVVGRAAEGHVMMRWTTMEGPESSVDERFMYMGFSRSFSADWKEIEIGGFAEDETKAWRGELLHICIDLNLSPAQWITEGPDEVWVDWITLTGPGEELIGGVTPESGDGVPEKVLFDPYVFYPVGGSCDALVSGDLDGDGDRDLVAGRRGAESALVLLFNDGTGGFGEQRSYGLGHEWMPILRGADLNRDGAMDVVLYKWGDTTYYWINDGEGRFPQKEVLDFTFLLEVGDFDGDGDVDVLTIPLEEKGLAVYPGEGDGTFGAVMREEQPLYTPTWAGDFDRDGDMDVLWWPSGGGTGYLLTLNDGEGHLDEGQKLGVDSSWLVGVGDLEGDGDVDLVVNVLKNPCRGLAVLRNRGDGEMVWEELYGWQELKMDNGSCSPSAWLGDVNEDGEWDVVLGSVEDATVIVLLGQPDGSLEEAGRYPVSGSPAGIVVADFDGDGDVDVAVADEVNGGVSILFNKLYSGTTSVGLDREAGNDEIWVGGLCVNVPNPFNAITLIPFDLAFSGKVTLGVCDVLGRKVRTLVEGPMSPGHYSIPWDGRDDEGHPVASGRYLVRLQAGTFRESKVMTLVK